jgi:serine/threonine-protein kinase
MQQWTRVRALFERALELEPADVPEWLEREEAEHPEIRNEVLALLRHHRDAGAFLASPLSAGADLLADELALQPGDRIGPYDIVGEIGRGGMGRVYLAHDMRLQRMVAVKALRTDVTINYAQRERFRREARAAAALSHPGICTIYALEELEGQLFIVTELLEGHTLREEIRQEAPPAAAAVMQTAREIAGALAAAHEKGIVHRDLKPENIMRLSNGRLKILDFGLARYEGRPFDSGVQLTIPGVVMGTPAYMAPEQLNGEAVDARADVFAFGVVLYEYAAGTHPFEAATPLSQTARLLAGTFVPLESRRPELSGTLSRAVNRSLQKAPASRYASGGALLRALGELDLISISSRSPVAWWWRAHQGIVMSLYVAACVALWHIKDIRPGIATGIFVAVGVLATAGTIVRGHLVFTERIKRAAFQTERARAAPLTLLVDLAMATALVCVGALLAGTSALSGLLAMALGIGICLARLILEPSTTAAAFPSA